MCNNSHIYVYQKRNRLCPRRSGSKNSVITLWICLVPSQLHTALRLKNWDTNKFLYPWIPVLCCLTDEVKIEVSKVISYFCNSQKMKEVNDLKSLTPILLPINISHPQNRTFQIATCLRPFVKCTVKIPCVWWPQLNTALNWLILLERQDGLRKDLYIMYCVKVREWTKVTSTVTLVTLMLHQNRRNRNQ
jgi:hypothetical protein